MHNTFFIEERIATELAYHGTMGKRIWNDYQRNDLVIAVMDGTHYYFPTCKHNTVYEYLKKYLEKKHGLIYLYGEIK